MITVRIILALVVLLVQSLALGQSKPEREIEIQKHSKLAQEELHANQPAAAMKEYQAILSLDGKNLDALANLGVIEFFAGDFAKATEQLRAALAIQSNVYKLRALLGMAEKRLGEARSAQADLQSAFTSLDEQKLRIQTGMELIEVNYGLNDLSRAAEVANTLRQIEPTNPDILFTAHRVYSDLADETTLSLAMTAPQSARMKQLMAHELARRADTAGAIANYRAAIAIAPKLSDLHFELADMLFDSSSAADQAEAEKEYKAALELNPFDEKSLCRLGDLVRKRDDTKAALEYYSRAYQLQPNDVTANLGIAKILMAMHEPLRAEPHLRRAAQVEPYDAIVHYRLGVVYRELGKNEDSKRELAEFEKLKKMKDNLRTLYQAMRLKPAQQDRGDTDVPQ